MDRIPPSSEPSTPRSVESNESIAAGLFTGESQRRITQETGTDFVPPQTIPKPSGLEITDRSVTKEAPKKEDLLKEAKEALIAKIKDPNSLINPEICKKVEVICRRELSLITILKINDELSQLSNGAKNNTYIDTVFFRPFKDKIENIPQKHKNHQKIFINERSKFIADLLTDSEGNIDKEVIDLIKDLINNPPNNPLKSPLLIAHNQVLLKILDALKNSALVDLINGLKKPGEDVPKSKSETLPKQNIENLVRATLGLDEGTTLTAAHSKQAVCAALLTDLRQGEMASCFATSVAIMVHDQNPLQVATELKQMIETGVLKNNVNGKDQNFRIPLIFIPNECEMDAGFATGGIDKFRRNPGIMKAVEMSGLHIFNDAEKLEIMLSEELGKLKDPKKSADILKGFIHQLAMHKAGLESVDFENVANFEKLNWQCRSLERERDYIRAEMKRVDITPEQKKDLTSREKALTVEIKKIIEDNRQLALAMDKKFGVGSNLRDKIQIHKDFKQKLEMNFMAAEGENSLLRSWEFSIAALGNAESGAHMRDFNDLLINPTMIADSWSNLWYRVWDKFVIIINDLMGLQIESLEGSAARRIGISYILDTILDEIEDTEDFDKMAFKKQFYDTFNEKLSERLEARFEGGVFKLYDRTRARSADLSVETGNPSAICGAIASIAYQAMENIQAMKSADANKTIKDRIFGKLRVAIQGEYDSDPRDSVFLKNLMLAYAYSSATLKIEKDQEVNLDTLEKQFIEAFSGGFAENIIKQYLGKTFENVVFGKEPELFIVDMVTQLHAMREKGALSKDRKISFPITGSQHCFILQPDMKILNKIMENPNSGAVKAWIARNLTHKSSPFIVADLNWEINGQHLYLAIKRDIHNKLAFVCINEQGVETPLPASDSDHHFGSEGFKVQFVNQ